MAKAKAAEGSLISADVAASYKVSDTKTASGRKSVDCDDVVARQLRGKTLKELEGVARENDLLDRWNATWKNLNPGQARMALGNALRVKSRGGKVKVKKTTKATKKKAVKKKKAA